MDAVSVSAQSAAVQEDPLRVLVAGAGVAGMTVAQLLRGQGLHPVLIERHAEAVEHGYMLALMPMVDQTIERLGVRERYLAASQPLGRYRLRSRTGRSVREDELGTMVRNYGDYRGISRGELMRVLGSAGGAISYRTTVTAMEWCEGEFTVDLQEGDRITRTEFDLIIVAEGMNSPTRELLAEPGTPGPGDPGLGEPQRVDTGWGGWVAWLDQDGDSDLVEELWGPGYFVGSYPVRGKIGVIVGGPNGSAGVGREQFLRAVRSRIPAAGDRVERALHAVAGTRQPFYWGLTDSRSPRWISGRTILLGDAAAGFLPTAGIGAGMAMESAGLLADQLHGVRPKNLVPALQEYQRVQRPRVESAQHASRRLARLMLRRGTLLARWRDRAMSRVSINFVLAPITKLLAEQPRLGSLQRFSEGEEQSS